MLFRLDCCTLFIILTDHTRFLFLASFDKLSYVVQRDILSYKVNRCCKRCVMMIIQYCLRTSEQLLGKLLGFFPTEATCRFNLASISCYLTFHVHIRIERLKCYVIRVALVGSMAI